jgi:hypothetical protein
MLRTQNEPLPKLIQEESAEYPPGLPSVLCGLVSLGDDASITY